MRYAPSSGGSGPFNLYVHKSGSKLHSFVQWHYIGRLSDGRDNDFKTSRNAGKIYRLFYIGG